MLAAADVKPQQRLITAELPFAFVVPCEGADSARMKNTAVAGENIKDAISKVGRGRYIL